MKKSELRQLIKEEISKILHESIKVDLDPDIEEITISGFGEEYTGTYNSEDESDEILFIHFFEDGEYHSEGDMPKIFSYLSKYGGETSVDDDEATLLISLENINKAI